jgi:ABC-type uncharacterized transport system permease subunit
MILSFDLAQAAGSAGWWLLPASSLLAALGYAVAALLDERREAALRIAFVGGWFFHALAILADALGAGSTSGGARFGFAPALSVTLWLVLAVYGVESRFVPLPSPRRLLAVLGVFAVALAAVYPGEFHPLATSRWAPLHWVLGLASYGLFGVAVLHAVLLNRAERGMREGRAAAAAPASGGVPLLRLERLTFRFVGVGFVVLTIALLLGAWFATPWRWDHKTLFSTLGWLLFAGLLLGRRLFGWRGVRATRWLYAGAALLLLAYVGSRFVLEVLLQRPPTP